MTAETRASLALALGGALWGLYWIPLRGLGQIGAEGAWPGLVLIAGPTLAALLLVLWQGGASRPVVVAGLVTGSGFGLYSAALLTTDIVRAVLFFYLTPIWGTLLGRFLLAERIGLSRLMALGAALCGLVVMLGADRGGGPALGWGDVASLVSGVVWAVGTMLFFRLDEARPVAQSAAFLTGALLVSLALLPAIGARPAPSLPVLALSLPAALYVLPMVLLTVWPAKILPPARAGLILMTEVVVGLLSAALFAGEPFGPREALGAALIVAAALIEVQGSRAA